MNQLRTGATKDLSRSLQQGFSLRALFSGEASQRQKSGANYDIATTYTFEVFFAALTVALLVQGLAIPSHHIIDFAFWHIIFAFVILLHAALLMYLGVRKDESPNIALVPALLIAYAAYLTWPLAVTSETNTALMPWCRFLGLYGLITPICLGNIRTVIYNVVGLSIALFGGLIFASYRATGEFQLDEALGRTVTFTIMALILGVFFSYIKEFARRVDYVYSDAVSLRLLLNQSKDQSKGLQEFDKLVHDNVMAALLDASRMAGPVADRTRTLARRAIRVLEEESYKTDPENSITFQELTEQIATGVYPWNARLRFVPEKRQTFPRANPNSTITNQAARAFTHAVTEAVSNSARHSGTRTTFISIRTELRRPKNSKTRGAKERAYIYCTVSDKGQGFNLKNLDIRRLGVRVSMIRSMEEVGGSTTIESAHHRGTTVTIQWPSDVDE
ncbi:ATP-binding protein [Rothia sp. P7181]|uniref:ATP-binding protein n=1 Tax=unclassified Rothia (in: high G+C Gram-positive bacteria) TaxID=2689056 RepID=UPI003AC213AB